MMIQRRTALLCLATAALGLASPAFAATAVISGTVTYRERIALPRGARLEVKLLDVSLADAPSRALVATTIRPSGNVPIPYRLRIDRSRIQPGQSYALQAQILVGRQLWFTTTTRHSVFGPGPNMTEIVVQRVASTSKSGGQGVGSPAGRWLAEDIGGGGVVDRVQTVLDLSSDGTYSGHGGCNRMGGRARIDGSSIAFGNAAATLMACTPAVMNQEQKFFGALRKARTWRIDPIRQKLTLLGDSGRSLVVFSRM